MGKQKAKSRKIVLKRFKILKSGKVMRKSSNTSHLNRKDSKSAKNRKKKNTVVGKTYAKKVKKMVY